MANKGEENDEFRLPLTPEKYKIYLSENGTKKML